jgi:formate/nitrite transporter FocA (FNT family)
MKDDANEERGGEAGSGDSGGGSASQKIMERPSAREIYQQVSKDAKDELARPAVSLAISGFASGMFMGLSSLGSALTLGLFGESPRTHLFAMMFYPVGFIAVILGRAQLFTENTLYPVALVLAEKRHFWKTMRLWSLVLPGNVLGALAYAWLAVRTSAVPHPAQEALVRLGTVAVSASPYAVFWTAVTAGWIIATAAWLVTGSNSSSGSIMILWILTFMVGLGNFAHCIATSGEILAALLKGQTTAGAYLHWLALAVAGNVCGGVMMVTLLEYGQTIQGKKSERSDK